MAIKATAPVEQAAEGDTDMGGGESSGTSTTTQTSEPWKGVQPYLKEGFQQAQNLYNSDIPGYYPNSTVVPFSPQTEAALQGTEARAMQGSPLNFAAQDYAMNTLNGDYLNAGNPYTDQLTQSISNQITPQVASAWGTAGRTGGAGQTEALSRGMTDALAPYMFNNYQNERGMQQNAMSAAPGLAMSDYNDMSMLAGVGAQREGMQSQILQDDINRWDFAQNLPQEKLNAYLAALGAGQGYGTTTTQQPLYSNGLASGLGALATGTGIAGTLFGAGGIFA